MGKVVVVGLDGATWDLLIPLTEMGIMPNLKEVMGESFYAPMESTMPPVTGPAWVSMVTGVNPGRHGCFDFNKPVKKLSHLRPIQSWDIKVKTFYELLEENGRKTILINLPVSFPPLTKNITLTSLLTSGNRAVFPAGLEERFPLLKAYRIFPDTRLRVTGNIEGYLRDIREVEKIRFECVSSLWNEKCDCFFVVFSGIDWVSHISFPSLIKNSDNLKNELEIFKDIDKYIGWFFANLKDDDHLIMVSDHGFQTARGTLFLNELLEKAGFLYPDYCEPSLPKSHRMEEESYNLIQHDINIAPILLSLAHRNRFLGLFPRIYRKIGGKWPLALRANAGKSMASLLTSECMGITIHESSCWEECSVRENEVDNITNNLQNLLSSMRDSEGNNFFGWIKKRDEVYQGAFTNLAPHLLLGECKWAISAAIRSLPKSHFFREEVGIHHPLGIFLCHGRGINIGYNNSPISIYDVTPMLLYLLEESVPNDIDGRIRQEVLKDEILKRFPPSFKEITPPVRISHDTEDSDIQERLKGLGYMG